MGLFGPPDVAKLKAKGDVSGLVKALRYDSLWHGDAKCWPVRRSAAVALGQLGDARAVEPLIACLRAGLSYPACEAATSLGQLGDARAVEPLIAALDTVDRDVRHAAGAALRVLRAPGVDVLVAHAEDAAAASLSAFAATRASAKASALTARAAAKPECDHIWENPYYVHGANDRYRCRRCGQVGDQVEHRLGSTDTYD